MSIHLTCATSDDPCHHTSGDNCCMLPAVPMGWVRLLQIQDVVKYMLGLLATTLRICVPPWFDTCIHTHYTTEILVQLTHKLISKGLRMQKQHKIAPNTKNSLYTLSTKKTCHISHNGRTQSVCWVACYSQCSERLFWFTAVMSSFFLRRLISAVSQSIATILSHNVGPRYNFSQVVPKFFAPPLKNLAEKPPVWGCDPL